MKVVGSSFLNRDENGDWVFKVRAKSYYIAQIVQAFGNSKDDDIHLRIEVFRQSVPKSLKQLGYYYGGLIPTLLIYHRDAGYDVDFDTLDLYMRSKYYSTLMIDISTGEERHVPKTFKDITKEELSEVINSICEIEFRENFNQEPPDPKAFERKKSKPLKEKEDE